MAKGNSEKAYGGVWTMMNRFVSTIRITLVSAVLLGVEGAQAHEGATGVVKDRMDRFKASKESVKQIKKALKTKDWSAIQKEANDLQQWASEMSNFFPEGSNGKPSEAKDNIWSDWDGFLLSVESYQEGTEKLVKASSNKSLEATATAFKATLKSCKSCHNDFKAD
jgi:cytochrome c556